MGRTTRKIIIYIIPVSNSSSKLYVMMIVVKNNEKKMKLFYAKDINYEFCVIFKYADMIVKVVKHKLVYMKKNIVGT